MYQRPPDLEYDGRSRLGSWFIGGAAAFIQLDLASDVRAGSISATRDGTLLVTMPRPTETNHVVVSDPANIDGHRVVIYAQTLHGDYVSADVFVDGYSLASGEPDTVMSARSGALAVQLAAPEARRRIGDRIELVYFVFLTIMATLAFATGETSIQRAFPYYVLLAGFFAVAVARPRLAVYARIGATLLAIGWLALIVSGHW